MFVCIAWRETCLNWNNSFLLSRRCYLIVVCTTRKLMILINELTVHRNENGSVILPPLLFGSDNLKVDAPKIGVDAFPYAHPCQSDGLDVATGDTIFWYSFKHNLNAVLHGGQIKLLSLLLLLPLLPLMNLYKYGIDVLEYKLLLLLLVLPQQRPVANLLFTFVTSSIWSSKKPDWKVWNERKNKWIKWENRQGTSTCTVRFV